MAPGTVSAAGLHNVYRVTPRLISGSSPDGDEGFHSLRRLGVRTIITVDGARPDVERARRFGMRYVHLPVGYDGVPRGQALRLARAVCDLPGPVYLHCHHGKHRGPAAAAVVHRFLDARCSAEDAVAEMRRAGTDPHYAGLYASARELRRPAASELAAVPADFPEISPVPALAASMVDIDERWERMRQVRAAGWQVPERHPDLSPPHEALQLEELFREAGRLPAVREQPHGFRAVLIEAQDAAGELERVLRAHSSSLAARADAAESAYRRIDSACQRCHSSYRDPPRTPDPNAGQ